MATVGPRDLAVNALMNIHLWRVSFDTSGFPGPIASAHVAQPVHRLARGPVRQVAVALGLVDLLSRRVGRVGVFRPMINRRADHDTVVDL